MKILIGVGLLILAFIIVLFGGLNRTMLIISTFVVLVGMGFLIMGMASVLWKAEVETIAEGIRRAEEKKKIEEEKKRKGAG